MIDVRLLNFVERSQHPGNREIQCEFRTGLTVQQLIAALGLRESDAQLIIVNGKVRSLETELSDGDRVALSAMIGGG
jgi:sulfur carrier protein ThiS